MTDIFPPRANHFFPGFFPGLFPPVSPHEGQPPPAPPGNKNPRERVAGNLVIGSWASVLLVPGLVPAPVFLQGRTKPDNIREPITTEPEPPPAQAGYAPRGDVTCVTSPPLRLRLRPLRN